MDLINDQLFLAFAPHTLFTGLNFVVSWILLGLVCLDSTGPTCLGYLGSLPGLGISLQITPIKIWIKLRYILGCSTLSSRILDLLKPLQL